MRRQKRKKIGSRRSGTIILIVVFLVGLSVLLYPTISDFVNQRTQTRAVAAYDDAVSQMTEQDYSEYFAAADAYNEALANQRSAFYDPDLLEGYDDILDISGMGIMGYITIEKIGVQLPIYHGTDEAVLEIAAGHLEGTSLPVGGENTHCVLSAHRGLPSAKLFTDIDELEEGDTFTITVLDRVLTYEADQILIVLPTEVDDLQIVDGEDYCTLLTCTPYGINTHRLLVRGHRIAGAQSSRLHVTAEAFQIEPIITAPIIAVPILVILLIWLLAHTKKKKKKKKQKKYPRGTKKKRKEKRGGDHDA